MDFSWKIVIDAGAVSIALLLATIIRSKIRLFQRFMIPNAITAGFLLLPFYNYIYPNLGYGSHKLGELVYHLLNISFVAMTLRAGTASVRRKSGGVVGTTTGILAQYALQALVGLLLTFLLISTISPSLSPAFGLFLPLGFALGPGQAYAIGRGWEALGFEGAGSVGLTFAAVGYLWSCFAGVMLINYGIKKGWMSKSSLEAFQDKALMTGIVPAGNEKPVGARLSTDSEAIDSFSFHGAIVTATYFLSYLLLTALTWALSFAGNTGRELAVNLWGINFIFSALTAQIVRYFMRRFKLSYVLDDQSLSRIAGMAVDFMVAGAIAAISLVFVGQYWKEILILSVACGIITTLTVPWMASRMFRDYRFERMLMIYGCSTGTLSTGLALLRVVDPEYRTPVAPDYMVSAGLTFLLAIPFILAINLPAKAGQTGNMALFWTMVVISAIYLLVTMGSYLLLARKRSFRDASQVWAK
jgi:ESS family glutamate:Na+ symporter